MSTVDIIKQSEILETHKITINWTDKSANMAMNVGKKCMFDNCGIVDMLPFECKYCKFFFCQDHRMTTSHNCTKFVDENWKPLDTSNKKIEPRYLKCQISGCTHMVENRTLNLMLAKCNKCNVVRCSDCRIMNKCCNKNN